MQKNYFCGRMRRHLSGRVAQLVRAFASHARGQGFESLRVHHLIMNDEYNSIGENSYSIEVKKSKFISRSFSVCSESDAKKAIDKISKRFHDAKHNVYAFSLLNGISRSSDDGEPSGTGGIQVLKVINNFNLKNNLIIVTRYFGGVLLGIGGLSRAYYSCADLLVQNSKITSHYLEILFNSVVSYKEYNKIINSKQFKIVDSVFSNDVLITFAVRKKESSEFKSKIENFLDRHVHLDQIQNSSDGRLSF